MVNMFPLLFSSQSSQRAQRLASIKSKSYGQIVEVCKVFPMYKLTRTVFGPALFEVHLMKAS